MIKHVLFLLLALACIAHPTVLSDAAAAMAPGEWRELSTTGYGRSLLDACDGIHSIFEWSNKAVWCDSREEFYYVGQGHYSCMKFINYRASTNSWRTLSNPPSSPSISHSYDNNCTDGENLYYSYYHGDDIYKYNFASNSWSHLTAIPALNYPASQPATAMDYYPELGGIVFCGGHNNPVSLYHLATGQWEILHPATYDYGAYSIMCQYNTVDKILIYGGPDGLYRINQDKSVTKLTTAPALLRVDGDCKLTHDPVGGKYLLMSRDEFYEFDAINDVWTFRPEGAAMLFNNSNSWAVVTPIYKYGVIMFCTWNWDNSKVLLYKHDPTVIADQKLTTIAISPKIVTIESGQTVTFSALGKDQYNHDFDDTFSYQAAGGGTMTDSTFQNNGTAGDFTVTVSGASDPSVTAAATVRVLDPEVNIVTLVDFGRTAAENLYGLPGWDSVSMDRYMGNVDLGPGGTKMTTGGTGDYNHQLVTGPARQFTGDEIIVVTWYNAVDSPTTFTPTMSFDDPDRPISGTTGTWHTMTQVTIPPKSTSETRLALAGIAGSYALVSVSHRHPNGAHILCDKIELLTQAGSSITDRVVGRGALALSVNPNPFKGTVGISLYGLRKGNPAGRPNVLTIYDPHGRMVHRVMDLKSSAYTWNASGLPAGVYLLRARAGNRTLMKKLVLTK